MGCSLREPPRVQRPGAGIRRGDSARAESEGRGSKSACADLDGPSGLALWASPRSAAGGSPPYAGGPARTIYASSRSATARSDRSRPRGASIRGEPRQRRGSKKRPLSGRWDVSTRMTGPPARALVAADVEEDRHPLAARLMVSAVSESASLSSLECGPSSTFSTLGTARPGPEPGRYPEVATARSPWHPPSCIVAGTPRGTGRRARGTPPRCLPPPGMT